MLDEMLKNPEDMKQYVSMVGADGWCRHFDTTSRSCTIYDTRPRFCRVSPETFKDLYDVEPEDMDEFSTDCCVYHISLVYGEDSSELQRFERAVGIPESTGDFDDGSTLIELDLDVLDDETDVVS